jgi:medium-chain acyl-[acyl-carrier-protein] hydrolase
MMKNNCVQIVRKEKNPKIRLFCFPYSGASASIYYSWIDFLPPGFELCSIQYPGRGQRIAEPLVVRLENLIDDLMDNFNELTDRPYATFGHSLGTLVSFELVRKIRSKGGNLPKHLFFSGHGAPHIPDTYPPIHKLPDSEFLSKLRELNGIPLEILDNNEFMEMISPVIRADFEICETYSYLNLPPFEIPISAFGGLEDPYVSRNELEKWKMHTLDRFTLRMFSGDHFYLNKSVGLITTVIARELTGFLV